MTSSWSSIIRSSPIEANPALVTKVTMMEDIWESLRLSPSYVSWDWNEICTCFLGCLSSDHQTDIWQSFGLLSAKKSSKAMKLQLTGKTVRKSSQKVPPLLKNWNHSEHMEHMKHLGNVVRKILAPSTSTLPQSPASMWEVFTRTLVKSRQPLARVQQQTVRSNSHVCFLILYWCTWEFLGYLDKSGKFTQDSKVWYLSPQLGISLNIF